MNPLIIILALSLLPGPVLPYGDDHAVNPRLARAPKFATSGRPFDIHYENDLIDVHVDNAPLGKVLHALALKTGVQVTLADPVIADMPVSNSVKGVSLAEGIKGLLDGFSYALYRIGAAPEILVLSKGPSSDHSSQATSPDDNRSHSSDEAVPRSLGEFQPIMKEEEFSEPVAESEQDPAAQSAGEPEQIEQLLNRALDAMNSEYLHLHAEAINQLQGIKDPRATQALMEAASTGMDMNLRAQAVEALRQHVADRQFADAQVVSTLKRLAADSDENISSIAHQALQDVQQYRE